MNSIFTAITLTPLDWSFIIGFFLVAIGIGIYTSRSAGKSEEDFFLGGRSMPWWLLGFSMVATTFSTDTPNFVTDIVRKNGVASNWMWWAFLLTGMLTVFVYAGLWRRSGVTTDVEFYEMRYSGKPAAFLRAFRGIYLGVIFNILIMAMVSVAAIKIGEIMLGLKPWQTLGYSAVVTVVFSALGGFKGVLLTDFLLFIIAMVGSVGAAYFALDHEAVGGMQGMMAHFNSNPELSSKLNIFPSSDSTIFISLFIIPLAVQWWAAYFPGAEPGGGGYLVQRMLAAKDEKNAVSATLFFNFAHYALRPWPWIIVALCSMIVFPDLASIQEAFPNAEKVADDSAYSAMLTFLPAGWMGLVLTSLIAAYMSTISTHLNWGSSYVVNDIYMRFIKPDSSPKEQVWVGRISTVVLMIVTAFVAMGINSAGEAFNIVIMMGAGTGGLLIVRWFWWRINAFCEIVAMIVSFITAIVLSKVISAETGAEISQVFGGLDWSNLQILIGVFITTSAWVITAFVAPQTEQKTLFKFIEQVNPDGPGWSKVHEDAKNANHELKFTHEADSLPKGILCMILGCTGVYSLLFAIGYWIYGKTTLMLTLFALSAISTILLFKVWGSKKPKQTIQNK
ncbi:Na+:solute symporter [Lentisphaera marina]|uniref:sodium:solute symporter family protein n=1 Tax=Lentisphaera marina TaxID=1111041 RepID=UPI002366F031|nr:sodium:solute symporter family protein [Lentisphaera marina]MDD7986400.1 Na+:solute symporter [Lentisphaera marina]